MTAAVEKHSAILATGMHRSGTSWLGHMLCAGGGLVSIDEPLSPLNRQTIFPRRIERWYTYIDDRNSEDYERFYQDAFHFRTHPVEDIKRMRVGSPRDPGRILRRWASFAVGRIQGRRLIIRDPFAVFSAEWFVRRLDCAVIVIVRHPAAVVSSLKRLGYSFDFENILRQPLLMERLEPFRQEMESFRERPRDVVGQGSLLWKMIYSQVDAFRDELEDVRVVRHEDLSLSPLSEYARLYEALSLPFTPRASAAIARSTRDSNPAEVTVEDPFRTRLDSHANLSNWRHRLEGDEIERIRSLTAEVASRYYPDDPSVS